MHPRASQPSVATVGLGWMRVAGGSTEVNLRPEIVGDLLSPSAGAISLSLLDRVPKHRARQENIPMKRTLVIFCHCEPSLWSWRKLYFS